MADISKIQLPNGIVCNIKSYKTMSIPMGSVDSTSTSTAFTATVDGINELIDGVCVWLTNGVVTSAAGYTIDINGLGAKPVYISKAVATASSTQFNVAYTVLLIYNSSRVSGGCWDYVYGYDADTTYSLPKLGCGYTTCSTETATAEKTASLSNYALATGGIVCVKFTNDVNANATLNINSKGAKNIYYQGAKITNGIIKANDTVVMVYSSTYHIIAIDRALKSFSNIKVNSTTITADTPQDTLELVAGTNITLTPDATNDKVTINADLSTYAPLASPTFTGTPAAPTATAGTDTTQIATTAFVQAAINNLDVAGVSDISPSKTISAWNEIDGNISVSTQDIAIDGTQTTLTGYQKSTTANQDVLETDTVNEAIGKIEKRVSDTENNICSLASNGGGINKATINDGSYTATKIIPCDPITGPIVVKFAEFTSTDTDRTISSVQFIYTDGTTSGNFGINRGTDVGLRSNVPKTIKSIKLFASNSEAHSTGDTFTFSGLEVCSFDDSALPYQPYAYSNLELTTKTTTNMDNIVSLQTDGVKNLVHITAYNGRYMGVSCTVTDTTFTVGVGTINSGSVQSVAITNGVALHAGTYLLSGCPSGGGSGSYRLDLRTSSSSVLSNIYDYGDGIIFTLPSHTYIRVYVQFESGYKVVSPLEFMPMLCRYMGDSTYQPYAYSNTTLTEKVRNNVENVQKNKNAISDLINYGPKNMIPYPYETESPFEQNGITFTTDAKGVIHVEGTNNGTGDSQYVLFQMPIPNSIFRDNDPYVLSVDATGTGTISQIHCSEVSDGVTSLVVSINNVTSGNAYESFVYSEYSGSSVLVAVKIASTNTTPIDMYLSIMICTYSEWGISYEYQPYAPSNSELYNKINENKADISKCYTLDTGTIIGSGDEMDLNNYTTVGNYITALASSNFTHIPTGADTTRGFRLTVMMDGKNNIGQIYDEFWTPNRWVRPCTVSGTFYDWVLVDTNLDTLVANCTKAIPTGSVDPTSTSTVYTATVDGITELRNGVCMLLTNSVVNCAANFTININNLGAKPVYGTMNTATRMATTFRKGYTLFFVYNETRVSGGCWDFVYYDTNNTVTQTHSTTDAEKNLLMSTTTSSTTTKTEGTYKSTKLTFNPSTGNLTTEKLTTPAITLNGNDLDTTLGTMQDDISYITYTNPFTIYADDFVELTGSGFIIPEGTAVNLPKGEYILSFTASTARTGVFVVDSGATEVYRGSINITSGSNVYRFTISADCDTIRFASSASITVTNLMIVSSIYYDSGRTEYIGETMTNAELTAKEQVNENNISLLRAYGGLKNYATINNGTYTANSGGGTHSITIPLLKPITGDIVISLGNITSNDVDSSTCAFVFRNDITSRETVAVSRGDNINVSVSMGTFVATKLEIYPAASYQTSGGDTVSWTDLMICTKEDWDYSHDYQPYALSNAELTNIAVPLSGKTVLNSQDNKSRTVSYQMLGADFGDIRSCGVYMIYIVNWSTTPAISVYAAFYSGGVTTYSGVTKIAGVDAQVTASGDTINVTATGKIQIIAMR